MDHMNADKIYWENAKWLQHKNAMHSFKTILEATSHQEAPVRQLTSRL